MKIRELMESKLDFAAMDKERDRLYSLKVKELEAETGMKVPHTHLGREGTISLAMIKKYGEDACTAYLEWDAQR